MNNDILIGLVYIAISVQTLICHLLFTRLCKLQTDVEGLQRKAQHKRTYAQLVAETRKPRQTWPWA